MLRSHKPTIDEKPKHSLLTLPGEIKDRIYRLLVVRDGPTFVRIIRAKRIKGVYHWATTYKESILAFVRASMQHDVFSVFHAENSFHLDRSNPGSS